MELANCAECGRVFVRMAQPICPDCLAAMEQDFEKVRRALDETPGLTPAELQERTKVPLERILRFLRDGRLQVQQGLVCEMCGAPIQTGHLCSRCQKEVEQWARQETRPGSMMYTWPRHRGGSKS